MPVLYGVEHTREAIDSVFQSIDETKHSLLIIDNNAEIGIKSWINHYEQISSAFEVGHITNEKNIYVNPAWQQGIDAFLSSDYYTHLIIMNSDLILQKDWLEVCINRWEKDPDEILLPVMVESKILTSRVSTEICDAQLVHEGTPGVFITLNRKQAEIINPLPTECLVWYGDQFIFEILRGVGYKTVIPSNLISFHYWSQNVQKVAGISELIEEDKRQWETVVKFRRDKIIEHELARIK